MSVRNPRLAFAGVIAAAAIAVPTAALASSPSAPAGKSAPPAATASKSPAPDTSAAAIKSAVPNSRGSDAVASKSAARQSPAQRSALEQAMVTALATQLGVSHSAAQRALDQLQSLGSNGIDPTSSSFAAIARSLGVTPARLAAAMPAAKQAAGQSLGGR